MAKEKNYNPVQAQRKADKAKAIKKGKADVAAKRNERLAKRNPANIQKQIDDLKATTAAGGKLSHHEEQVLDGLEKELKAVQKAREALGDAAPQFRSGGGPRRDGDGDRGALGKRRRGFDDVVSSSDSDGDVPEDVRSIPMPRDTPPPIPKDVMDKWWAKRRAKRNTNANLEPLGSGNDTGGRGERQQSTPAPVVEAKTVYEAKPMVRDLRKEAVAFMPTVVRQKLDKSHGKGGLIEPEEADRLEREGYLKSSGQAHGTESTEVDAEPAPASRQVLVEEVEDEEG